MRPIYKVRHLPVFLALISHITVTLSEFVKPSQPPHIVKKIDKQIELKYGPINRFVLECVANAEPLPSYSWFKNDAPLDSDSAGIKLISSPDHSQLEFSSPAPEHEGYYYCQAENDYGKAKSTVAHITNAPSRPPKGTTAPVFLTAPESELPSAGSTATFECIAEGKPEPTIAWMKNGEKMVGETGNKLVLNNIGSADVANYACNASNIAGYEYKDVYLNILTVSATIHDGPRDQIVSKGSNVTMRCETDGFPKPSIQWFLNETAIADSDKFKINAETGELRVMNAVVEDEGVYKCLAQNHGTISREGHLVVKSKTEIIDGPRDLSVVVFSTVTMNCSVVSDLSEKLTVIWKKNNVDLGQTIYAENERISQDENYSLVIRDITLDDEGTYTCVAFTESTGSAPATDSGLLSVSGIKPVLAFMDPIPAQLEGSDINIHCDVTEGFETPEVTWFKDGLLLEASDRVTVDSATVRIKDASTVDSGEYICKAVNSWGSDQKMTNVLVRKRTKILSDPVYVEFAAGHGVMLDCNVEVDVNLRSSLNIEWFKEDQPLQASMSSLLPSENNMVYDDDYSGSEESRFTMFSNNSILISNLQEEDIGFYKCSASTELEPLLRSEPSQIYLPSDFPFWVIILAVLIVLLVLVCLACLCRLRRKKRGKGFYGVKDIEKHGGRHNKSDIYYTTDGDSVMNEQDNMPLNTSTPTRTPIFTPKTIRHLSNMDKSAGSVGSLLQDDEFLKRGMDEDGSFHERYAD